ncbi:MAG: hypothetical protein NVS1B5_07700 [Gemmatimonadaceae bacterium]
MAVVVNPVAGAHPAVAVAVWEEAAVVAVRPEEEAAAAVVNSFHSSGASRSCDGPFFS